MKLRLIDNIRDEGSRALRYLDLKNGLADIWAQLRKLCRRDASHLREESLLSIIDAAEIVEGRINTGCSDGSSESRLPQREPGPARDGRLRSWEDRDVQIQAIKVRLLTLGRRLKAQRPFIIRHIVGLALLGTLFAGSLAAVTYIAARAASTDGLVVDYYRGPDFEKRVARRYISRMFVDFGGKRPALGVPRDRFSARFKGFLIAPETAEYSFFAQSDDGMRFYLDGDLLIDNWQEQEWIESGRHAKILLNKGKHAVFVEFYNSSGNAAIRLRWAGGPIPKNTVLAVPYLQKR